MSLDDRLNPDFIREKLLEVFNQNARDDENYTVDSGPDILGIFNGLVFMVKNNGRECYVLEMPVFEDGKYIIKGGLNTKCSIGKGSGTKNISNIILFGKQNGYDLFNLLDASTLDFTFVQEPDTVISLALSKFLTIGNTWYSQFGFENNNTRLFEPQILPIIDNTFSSLFTNVSQVIDKNSDSDYKKKEAKYYIQRELESFISNIIRLPNLPNSPESIKPQTKIKDCFKMLIDYLYVICPHNKCPDDQYRILKMIKDFMYFIFFIISLIIFNSPRTVLILNDRSINYKKISEIVNMTLSNFNNLTLVLNPQSMVFVDDEIPLSSSGFSASSVEEVYERPESSSGFRRAIEEIDGGKSKKYRKSMKMKGTKRKGPRNKKRKTLVKKYKKIIKGKIYKKSIKKRSRK